MIFYFFGKVCLDLIQSSPEPLKSLLSGEINKSLRFSNNTLRYNSPFQNTSLEVKEGNAGNFLHTF